MIVKIIWVIVIARVLDLVVLTFSRRLKKGRITLRLGLLSLITLSLIASLFIEVPFERGQIFPSGVQREATHLSKEITDRISNYQLNLEISKVPYLKGKTVATIGDSITEIDGRDIAKIGKIIGYQDVFRKQGATVITYGYSGATYSRYSKKISKSTHASLYEKIVVKKVDFKEVDIVTLFAGTNDIGQGYAPGKSTESKLETAVGGLKGIIDYIRKNNPEVQIFIFSPTKRFDQPFDQQLKALDRELIKVGESYDIPVDNLFETSGIEAYNQQVFLYDGLHPNNQGLALLGEEMVAFIESNQGAQK